MARNPRQGLTLPESGAIAPEPRQSRRRQAVAATPQPEEEYLDPMREQNAPFVDADGDGVADDVKDYRQSGAFWASLGTILLPLLLLLFNVEAASPKGQLIQQLTAQLQVYGPILATMGLGVWSMFSTLFRKQRLGIIHRDGTIRPFVAEKRPTAQRRSA